MNAPQPKGSLKTLMGRIKEAWGELTDDEIAAFEGKRDRFFDAVQRKYGIARSEAERMLAQWERTVGEAG